MAAHGKNDRHQAAQPQAPQQAQQDADKEPARPAPVPPPAASIEDAPPVVDMPESITIDVPAPKPSDESSYWIGLTSECPLDNATVGGFAFCRRTQGLEPLDGRDGMLSPSRQQLGGVVRMTPRQLAEVKARMAKAGIMREVRRRSVVNGATTLSTRNGEELRQVISEVVRYHYPRADNEDSLAWFAFIKPVPHGFQPDLGVAVPPPLAKRPS